MLINSTTLQFWQYTFDCSTVQTPDLKQNNCTLFFGIKLKQISNFDLKFCVQETIKSNQILTRFGFNLPLLMPVKKKFKKLSSQVFITWTYAYLCILAGLVYSGSQTNISYLYNRCPENYNVYSSHFFRLNKYNTTVV